MHGARYHARRNALTIRWQAVRHATGYEIGARLRGGQPLRLRIGARVRVTVALAPGAHVTAVRARALRGGVPGAFANAKS